MSASSEEVAELQQRLRVSLHVMAEDLLNAGSGLNGTSLAGPLSVAFPPVVPYRRGQQGEDALAGVAFRPDVMSVAFVAGSPAQATVLQAVDLGGLLRVTLRPNCGASVPVSVCGFVEGMRVVLFEPWGAHDFMTVEDVNGPDVDLSYAGVPASTYAGGTAVIGHLAAHTYAIRPDPDTAVPQLTHYDGFVTERAVADHVVALSFEYFGEADPPRLRTGAIPGVTAAPATYGPGPPAIGVLGASTAWPAGENCLFTVVEGTHVPRLAVLGAPGELVDLSEAALTDGPWCPDAASPRRYDADLLRVRKVRLRLRVEVALRAMRGAAGPFFARAGVGAPALISAPDHEATLDIVLRNLMWR
jgi:hypothetical protein